MKRPMFVLTFTLVLVLTFALNVMPAHAAVSGSLTTLSFPGATATNCGTYALASGGSVTSTTSVSDVGTLYDGNGTVIGGFSSTWIGTFTTTNINFAIQPAKNPIRMVEVLGGVTVVDLSADNPCLPPSGAGAGKFFNPGDGRVDPRPGDRLAVYCNTGANPPNVDVWGVLNDSSGRRLFTFTFSDLVKAGAKGITKKVEPLGTIYLSVDANNWFVAVWTGGPAAATGTKDFAKSFTCNFAR
jgi:hypothetical protein